MADETTNQNKEFETRVGLGILAGSVALIGLAAGYLYGTEEGRRQRKQLSGWLANIRNDIISQLENLRYIDEDTYCQIIDDVVSRYRHVDEIDAGELLDFAHDMKDHYETVRQQIEQGKEKASSKKNSKSSSSTTKKSSGTKRSSSKNSGTKSSGSSSKK